MSRDPQDTNCSPDESGLFSRRSFGMLITAAFGTAMGTSVLGAADRAFAAQRAKVITAKPKASAYYVPSDKHRTEWTSKTGAVLYYSTKGSAIVNGTRVRFIWETMRKAKYVRSIPRTSSMTFNKTLKNAVKKFQKAHGLTADGAVGPKTWKKMNQYRGTNFPFTMDSYIAPTEKSAKGGDSAARIQAMIQYFERFEKRAPYTWGGAGYKNERWAGFDCSGLVYQMVAAGGIVIESTNPVDHARRNYRSTQSIYSDKKLRSIPIKQMRDGDIVTFASRTRRAVGDIRHDGIYYKGYLLESAGGGVQRTRWKGGTLRGNRYPMPYVKRPFA